MHTDLIKIIGSYKKQFEYQMDLESLNNTYLFQYINTVLFLSKQERTVIQYNDETNDRLSIQICRCGEPYVTVSHSNICKHVINRLLCQ